MKTNRFTAPLLIVSGLLLAAFGSRSLQQQEELRHSRNPLAVQQSAYGKLLARLGETTIDRVWHLGVEQIVPHYMSGLPHDVAAKTDGSAPETTVALPAGTPMSRGKRWIQDRVIAQHSRTNPNSLTPAHLATVYRDIENMLLRSFKLDPTHYGAYDSYHLFLTTSDFGGTPMANQQAKRIADIAIATAETETEDPEPWLTAAAAGMNLYLMDAAPYNVKNEPIPVDMLKHYRNLIGRCLQRFDEIQGRSEQSGIWENLSMERQMEIAERSLFAKRTFKQFDTLIARAESRAAEGTTSPQVAGAGAEQPE
jgi:hypothetical protein